MQSTYYLINTKEWVTEGTEIGNIIQGIRMNSY